MMDYIDYERFTPLSFRKPLFLGYIKNSALFSKKANYCETFCVKSALKHYLHHHKHNPLIPNGKWFAKI